MKQLFLIASTLVTYGIINSIPIDGDPLWRFPKTPRPSLPEYRKKLHEAMSQYREYKCRSNDEKNSTECRSLEAIIKTYLRRENHSLRSAATIAIAHNQYECGKEDNKNPTECYLLKMRLNALP